MTSVSTTAIGQDRNVLVKIDDRRNQDRHQPDGSSMLLDRLPRERLGAR
jgi:hypothetical protein